MGILKYLADKLEASRANIVNVPVSILLGAIGLMGSGAGVGYLVIEDHDEGTVNHEQAAATLKQEISNLSTLDQTDGIQKQIDVLAVKRQLSELETGKWGTLSDENKAYTKAVDALETDMDFANEKFKLASQPVVQNLLLNTDISEKDYSMLKLQLLSLYKSDDTSDDTSENEGSKVTVPWANYALKECQAESMTDGVSLSAQFEGVKSCMQDEENDGFPILLAALMGGVLFTVSGSSVLGAGLNKADQKLTARRRRRKQKKIQN